MKLKLFSVILVSVFLLCVTATPLEASSKLVEAEEIRNGIIEYNLKKGNFKSSEEWIEKSFPLNVGISTEWYVLALSQWGKYNFSPYEKALSEYLETKKVSSASTRLKFALVLASIGSESEYIKDALENSMGKQGIMSVVFGLHLLNNGYVHSSYTVESAVDELLSLQLSKGGWALRNNVLDVDVTAMVIQALAPHYSQENVKKSIDNALNAVSEKMLEDCDFLSYGVANPESGCQVIVALSSLGIDFSSDERFIRNGKNLLDGIIKYKMSDSSFSHSSDMKTNENSTVQVFLSTVSYERMKRGKGSIYILESRNIEEGFQSEEESFVSSENLNSSECFETSENMNSSECFETSEISDSCNSNVSIEAEVSEEINNSSEKGIEIKKIIIIILLIIYILTVVFLIIRKKFNIKNFIFVTAVFAVLLLIAISTDIQTKDSYYNSSGVSKENAIGTVFLSIRCDVLNDVTDNSYIPKDGTILNQTEFSIKEGETVYDILVEAAKKYSIHIENNGTSDLAYISGINYLYEFDYGDLSGWIFKVNGEESSVGCSSYVLADGDIVEWCYSLNYGKDV